MEKIRADSFVLVYRDRRRKWLVRPSETPKLHTHLGILDCASLVGMEFGVRVNTTMNDELVILKPTREDIGDPWELVKPVKEAMAPSAMLAGICPTMNQAERLVQTLHEEGFVATETLELIARNIEARPGMTRPSMFMVAHTAYLIFGRKL